MFCGTSEGDPYDHFCKGWQLYSDDDYKAALKYFHKYLAAEPGDFNAIYWIGVALSLDKQYDLALKYYDFCLVLSPGGKNLIEERENIIKDIQENQQKLDQAQLKLKKLQTQSYILSKANRLYNKENYKDALKHFLKYLAAEPGDIDTIYWIGKTLYQYKQYDLALKYYDFCLVLQPGARNIISERTEIVKKIKEVEEAAETKQQLEQTQPKIKKSQIQPAPLSNGSVPISNNPNVPLIFSSVNESNEKKENVKKKGVTFNPDPEIIFYNPKEDFDQSDNLQQKPSGSCIIS